MTDSDSQMLSDSETLALIKEHLLTVSPSLHGGGWYAKRFVDANPENDCFPERGDTINEAVRRCLASAKRLRKV